MNTWTVNQEDASDILVKRRWPWWRSLWVRIPAIFLLMWVITGIFFWWECRSAWAVFRVNGVAEPAQESPIYSFRQRSGLASYVAEFYIKDRDVTNVLLHYTGVDDRWLVRLRRFPKIERATFDGGQIGQGLQNLSDLRELKAICVIGEHRTVTQGRGDFVNSTISGRHFLLIPQLEILVLSGFKGSISDVDQLRQHPHLQKVVLEDISQLSLVLGQFELCQNIKSLFIRQKAGLDEGSLASICRLSHLETLTICGVTKTDEMDSQLKNSMPTTSIYWRP